MSEKAKVKSEKVLQGLESRLMKVSKSVLVRSLAHLLITMNKAEADIVIERLTLASEKEAFNKMCFTYESIHKELDALNPRQLGKRKYQNKYKKLNSLEKRIQKHPLYETLFESKSKKEAS